MGTQRVQIKAVLPMLVRWACRANFCPALAALVGPVQNIFSSLYTILIHLSPSPSMLRAASRAGSPVSLYVSFFFGFPHEVSIKPSPEPLPANISRTSTCTLSLLVIHSIYYIHVQYERINVNKCINNLIGYKQVTK